MKTCSLIIIVEDETLLQRLVYARDIIFRQPPKLLLLHFFSTQYIILK